ncbi:unnamed protein product [Amoebophrya sp. A120]|nr:unnamed protein product [Amoebophrya sp. A120]|eukprot:GSA120T00024442001.1
MSGRDSSTSRSRSGDSSRKAKERKSKRQRSVRRNRRSSSSRGKSNSPIRERSAGSDRRSRSPKKTKSGDGKGEEKAEETVSCTLKLSNNDAAFVLGRNGKTKVKIANASGVASLSMDDLVLQAKGTQAQVDRAMKYSKFLTAQRVGPVLVERESHDDGDLTLLDVPNDACGFVTGRGGNFLRTIEDEWSVLMFFADYNGKKDGRMTKEMERLAIFGADRRNRRGAELKVLSAIESKCAGYFEKHRAEILARDEDGENWRSGVMPFSDDSQLSFALGKNGATRRKLEKASGCLLQYIGNVAVFTGDRARRRTLRQYMKWLFAQLDGPVDVPDAESRDDCTMLKIPRECVGYITGSRRAALSTIEMDFGCLMFFTGIKSEKTPFEWLAIFGDEQARKGAELKVKSSVESKEKGYFSKDLEENRDEWKNPGFSTDIMHLKDEAIAYCLGQGGSTRVKLALASGCHVQIIGEHILMAGTLEKRRNCHDYVKWLLEQRHGKMDVDARNRKDCLEVAIPAECIGWVTGKHGNELRKVEEQTRTFCFLARVRYPKTDVERLLVFGQEEGHRNPDPTGRLGAQRLVEDLIQEKQSYDRDRRGNGTRRRDSRRRRSRSMSKRRDDSRGRGRGASRGGRRSGGRRNRSRNATRSRRRDSRRR